MYKLYSGLPREAISLERIREHDRKSTPGSKNRYTKEASKYSLPKKNWTKNSITKNEIQANISVIKKNPSRN